MEEIILWADYQLNIKNNMSNILKDTWKEDHLDFQHEGSEMEFQTWCPLCKAKVDGAGESAPTLGIDISDQALMKDKLN